MSIERSPHRHAILMHVVGVSLTPLIPIPFADDFVASGIRRRLVRMLAEAYKVPLTEAAVRALADLPGTSLTGRIGRLVSYPVRRVLRKVFFVLEWKRALDTLGDDTLRATLLDHAFARGYVRGPNCEDVTRVSGAIERAVARADRGLFHRTARAALARSATLVRSGVAQLARALTRQGADASKKPEEAGRAFDTLRSASIFDELAGRLDRLIDSLPADYLPGLRRELDAELAASAG